MSLFDDFSRVDEAPALQRESSFTFLNRIATPGWTIVRDELGRWYEMYCEDAEPEKARDLRQRFRSTDGRQHHAAWWELYDHRLLRALCPGQRICCEPALEAVATRPDFVVVEPEGGVRLTVESVTASAGIVDETGANRALVADIIDAINDIPSDDFWVHLEIRTFGTEQPRRTETQRPIREWLATLDREVELGKRASGLPREPQRFRFRGWEIDLEPMPKSTPSPHHRLVGIGPSVGGFVNDAANLRSALLTKARRYGVHDKPFVVAIAPTGPILHDEDVVQALLGSTHQHFDPSHEEGGEVVLVRDGAWSSGAEAVSAVLIGAEILPWTVAKIAPTVWVNPYLDQPLDECLAPLPRIEFTAEGEPVRHEGEVSIAELLGLDPQWPGELWPEREEDTEGDTVRA